MVPSQQKAVRCSTFGVVQMTGKRLACVTFAHASCLSRLSAVGVVEQEDRHVPILCPPCVIPGEKVACAIHVGFQGRRCAPTLSRARPGDCALTSGASASSTAVVSDVTRW